MSSEDQVVRYADVDGHTMAWSAVGSGPPLVVNGWWSSSLELDWHDAAFRSFIALLAEHHTVVRYDRVGTGLSDRSIAPLAALDREVASLAALLDEVASGPVSFFGAASGGLVAAAYATEHPDRVERLVIYGSYVSGHSLAPLAARESLLSLVGDHWGDASRRLADLLVPDGTVDERVALSRSQRRCAGADTARASLTAIYDFDVSEYLPQLQVPTLVMHRRDDRAVPVALGREVAARIPGSRFVALEGTNHYPWRGDGEAVARVVGEFLGVPRTRGAGQRGVGDLTPREWEVLRLVTHGMTDLQIADKLVLSAHTVHRHVANVRRKLGVTSRSAAAAWAAHQGLA